MIPTFEREVSYREDVPVAVLLSKYLTSARSLEWNHIRRSRGL